MFPVMVLREEAHWWLDTAEGDLAAAHVLCDAGRFNLSAYHSQQAAEKALKAVLVSRGKTLRSHACVAIVAALKADGLAVYAEIEAAGRRLDLHYVQSRYPNGLGGDPTRYYDAAMADECLGRAEKICQFSRTILQDAS